MWPDTEDAEQPNADHFGLVGVSLEGRFRIDRVIGEGGFAVVYAGHHIKLDVPVAVKVLKTPVGLDGEATAAFIRDFTQEAQTIARMRHANIVQVLDTGVETLSWGAQAPWIVLEWLEGRTLEDDIVQTGRRTPAATLELLRPVFEALAYAHDAGVAHRDVKPSNIMIVRDGGRAVPKVLDFGISKLMNKGEKAGTGQTRTRSRNAGFSPHYASPEQVGSARTGPWTDVHALGLVVTECLTGQPAYPRTDMTETLRHVLAPERPTPARFGVDAGPWEPVLAKALAFRPDDRFENARAMLTALEQALPAGDLARTSAPSFAPQGPVLSPRGLSPSGVPAATSVSGSGLGGPSFTPPRFAPPSAPTSGPPSMPPFAAPAFTPPPAGPAELSLVPQGPQGLDSRPPVFGESPRLGNPAHVPSADAPALSPSFTPGEPFAPPDALAPSSAIPRAPSSAPAAPMLITGSLTAVPPRASSTGTGALPAVNPRANPLATGSVPAIAPRATEAPAVVPHTFSAATRASDPPASRNGPRIAVVIAIVALVLGGVGVGLFYGSEMNHSAAARPAPAPTAPAPAPPSTALAPSDPEPPPVAPALAESPDASAAAPRTPTVVRPDEPRAVRPVAPNRPRPPRQDYFLR